MLQGSRYTTALVLQFLASFLYLSMFYTYLYIPYYIFLSSYKLFSLRLKGGEKLKCCLVCEKAY